MYDKSHDRKFARQRIGQPHMPGTAGKIPLMFTTSDIQVFVEWLQERSREHSSAVLVTFSSANKNLSAVGVHILHSEA